MVARILILFSMGFAQRAAAQAPAPDCLAVASVGLPVAFTAAPRCMGTWTASLRSTVPQTRQRARSALALIGGREAVDALRADYERSKDPMAVSLDRQALGAVIQAMATTGSDADVKFLIAQLSLPVVGARGNAWPHVQAAALTLGFLRTASAREPLRALAARSQPSTFVEQAAHAASTMLDRPPCADSVAAPVAHELLRIIMTCQPTFMYRGTSFREDSSDNVWRYVDSTWRLEPRAKSDTSIRGSVSASVTLVPSGEEAFVGISTWCGMLCGEGWTYRLRRRGRVWQVIAARFDWVS